MNKLRISLKIITASLLLTFGQASLAQEQEVATTYSDQDKQKAIVMCMTAEYVQFHQEYPAEADVMDTCKLRFKQLSNEIPYQEYQKWVLETPYSPYPPAETAAILEKYHRIMLGLGSQIPFVN